MEFWFIRTNSDGRVSRNSDIHKSRAKKSVNALYSGSRGFFKGIPSVENPQESKSIVHQKGASSVVKQAQSVQVRC